MGGVGVIDDEFGVVLRYFLNIFVEVLNRCLEKRLEFEIKIGKIFVG